MPFLLWPTFSTLVVLRKLLMLCCYNPGYPSIGEGLPSVSYCIRILWIKED